MGISTFNSPLILKSVKTAYIGPPPTNSLRGIHPVIDDLLKDTYGCIIYQEQVMKLVQVVFMMSL